VKKQEPVGNPTDWNGRVTLPSLEDYDNRRDIHGWYEGMLGCWEEDGYDWRIIRDWWNDVRQRR
jgi:hypothetical protein